MAITFSDMEARDLAHALDAYLAQLRIEASRTEPNRLAHELWEQERRLTALRDKLPR